MKINSVSLTIHYNYYGDSIIISDNTFDGNPGTIEFIDKKKNQLEINSVDDVIEILQDFKRKFNVIKEMEEKI
jgi:hypothetical protein